MTIFKNDRIYIRLQEDTDEELMIPLLKEGDFTSYLSDDDPMKEGLLHAIWEQEHNEPNAVVAMIFDANDNRFIGRIQLTRMDEDAPEAGINLLKKYHDQGYGTESMKLFLNWCSKEYHISKVQLRIWKHNTRSQHVAEKLGAKLEGETTVWDEELLKAAGVDFKESLEELDALKPYLYFMELPVS